MAGGMAVGTSITRYQIAKVGTEIEEDLLKYFDIVSTETVIKLLTDDPISKSDFTKDVFSIIRHRLNLLKEEI